jgi:hypothetical protein
MAMMCEYAKTPTPRSASSARPDSSSGIRFASSVWRTAAVPVISRFFGLVIVMYHNEHGPPHFHVRHGDSYASVEILTGRLRGDLPPTVLRHLRMWMTAHRPELLDNWNRAQTRRSLSRIAPLE